MTLEDPPGRWRRVAENFAEVRGQLEQSRFIGQSDDERIMATVDWKGHLVGLRMDPKLLRGTVTDTEGLTSAILLATQRARIKADTGATELLQRTFGSDVDTANLRAGTGLDGMIKSAGKRVLAEQRHEEWGADS